MSERTACVIAVFARAPVPGAVKTRLSPPLSAQQAAELQRKLLWHTLDAASSAALGPIELWCTPNIGDPFFYSCQTHFGLQLKTQGAGDLGVKMGAALGDGLTRADRVILIGSDCPAIGADYLRQAADALATGYDVVVGPAEDGGYGLVGVFVTVPDIFTGIPWGTDLVMNATLGRLRNNGAKWCELPPIWDVDRPEDLARLAEDPQLKYLMKGFVFDRIAIQQ
jgi:uncharacterized protein